MELASITIKRKLNDTKPVVIAPLGDIQYSGKKGSTATDLLRRHVDRIVELDGYVIGLGDYCMPFSTKILTKEGFKTHDQLKQGELVLAFDGKELVWTPLLGVYINPSVSMTRLKSKSFEVVCSPKHDWWVQLYNWRSKKKLINKRTTKELTTNCKIITSAKNYEKGDLDLTSKEAALLGWIVIDGTIKTKQKLSSGDYTTTLNITISQSKEPYRSKLRKRFSKWITSEYTTFASDNTSRTFSVTLDCSKFHLKTKRIRKLLNKLGCDDASKLKQLLPSIVTRLHPTQRKAMLKAMLQAEGWKEHNRWRFSQNPGPVLDAFKILATLEGYRMGLGKKNINGTWQIPLMGYRPNVGVADLEITENVSVEPAWCPKTKFRSWVCQQGQQITITGNSDFASPSNRQRLAAAALYDSATDVIDDAALDLIHELYELYLKPLKGRVIGLLSGHHWAYLKHGDTTDMRLCQLLDTKFLGTAAFIRIQLLMNGSRNNVTIFAHHGCGGGQKASAPLNKLENLAPYWDADIFLLGHMTKQAVAPINRISPRWHGQSAPDLTHRKIYMIGCGGFSKSYVAGIKQGQVPMGHYPEQKLLNPVALGAPIIYIKPSTQLKSQYSREKRRSVIVSKTFTYDVTVEV